MVFLGNDGLRRQTSDLHARGARRSLQQPDKLVGLFFFGHDGFQRIQLFGERIHLLLQFSVALFVNLELRDFLV